MADYSKITWDDLAKQADAYHNIDNNVDGGLARSQAFRGAGLDQYGQPLFEGDAHNFVGVNRGNPDKPGWNTMITPDGKGGVNTRDYKQDNGNWMYMLPALLGAGAIAGGAGLFGNLGGATGAAGGGFTIPSAGELSAAGMDVGGMGLTGAGGIGSVSSLADAGIAGGGAGLDAAGAAINPDMHFSDAGYDAGNPTSFSGTNSALTDPRYANESAKFLRQQGLADSGVDLLPTNLDTINLSSGLPTDLIKNIAKKLLNKDVGGGVSSGGSGGYGGASMAFNAPANETPGMIQGQAAPQQLQSALQAIMLSNPEQPKFNAQGYMPVPQQDAQMMALAKALQEDA